MMYFPDGILRRERALRREELEIAQEQYYEDTRNPETQAAYLQALKRFADLVLYSRLPEPAGDAGTHYVM